MGAQDHTEKVLRDIHVLFSKAEPYPGSAKNVVVDKNEMMELLKELNTCMYDMLEEHELSARKKDKANREMQKQGDDIIFEATRKAEDIYGASILYTDNALNQIQDIMKEATLSLETIYAQTRAKLVEERRQVKNNQSELKSQLEDLIDTQKYLHLIDEENRRRQTEKDLKVPSAPDDKPSYAGIQPEIRINKDYFIANGIPLEDEENASGAESAKEDNPENDEGAVSNSEGEISQEEMEKLSRELDREYFDWADGKEEKKESEKKGFSFFKK